MDAVLFGTVRSPSSGGIYAIPFTAPTITGSHQINAKVYDSAGNIGTWLIDPTITPRINAGASAWHADLFTEVKARSGTIVSAFSMELVEGMIAPGYIRRINAMKFKDTSTFPTGF